jgi:hypothetical protein
MIELRYVNRPTILHYLDNDRYISKDNLTLQYRKIMNPLEVGLQYPIWSDWQDVPTVEESDANN